jgi:polar amino acid transport system substrate-binding protein
MNLHATCRIVAAALLLAAPAIPKAHADDAAARKELAPTGKMRVAIAVGPAPSGIYVLKDAASGGYRGVTIDLSSALAKKLGVQIEYVPYAGSGEIQKAASTGVWDVAYMPVDDERKKVVDFGSPYHLLQSTYLAAPTATSIQKVEDANKAGVRIAGVTDTATFRASNKASPNATHISLKGPDDAIALMLDGKADAISLGRASLGGVAAKIPGSRVIDGGFLNSTTAVAVPKDKPAALAYVSAFIEDAKASGLVRKAFDDIGLKNEQVAPAGMKP